MQIGRIVQASDFQRVLGTPVRERSAHFAVHYLGASPEARPRPSGHTPSTDLSTGAAPACPQPVDDSPATAWFGWVVPKRHARRSVTRNLIKRQMRAAVQHARPGLANGMWVLRLRQGFAVRDFPSAASNALRDATRRELEALMSRAARPKLRP